MGAKRTATKADGGADVLEVIAAMPDWERTIGERLHTVILASAPELKPRLWYGQPAYAKERSIICFFRGAAVDKERYVTFGFSGDAKVDNGNVWATSFAITALTPADEAKLGKLVKKATQ